MSQLAEAHRLCRGRRPVRPANLHAEAEGILRELAFVYQAARSVRESMMEDAANVERCQMGGLHEACC